MAASHPTIKPPATFFSCYGFCRKAHFLLEESACTNKHTNWNLINFLGNRLFHFGPFLTKTKKKVQSYAFHGSQNGIV